MTDEPTYGKLTGAPAGGWHAMLDRLEAIEARLDGLSARLEVVEDRLSQIGQQVAATAQSLANILARMDQFDQRLRRLEDSRT